MGTLLLYDCINFLNFLFSRLYRWFTGSASVETATGSRISGLLDSPFGDDTLDAYGQRRAEERHYENQRDCDLRQALIRAKHACSAELITGMDELAKRRAAGTVDKFRYDAAVAQLQRTHDKDWRDVVDTAKRVYGRDSVEKMLFRLDLG